MWLKKSALLLAATLLSYSAQAEVWVLPELPGYAEKGADGNYKGLTIDLVDEITKRSGVAIEKKVEPAGRALSNFLEGTGDYFSFIYDERMSEYVYNLGKLGGVALVAATPKDKPAITKLEELYNLEKIGVVRGAIPVGPIAEDPKIKRVEVTDTDTGLKMLMGGRIDTMVASKVGLLAALNHLGKADEFNLGTVGTLDFATYAQKKLQDAESTKKIKAAADAFVAEGGLDAMLTKHFGDAWKS